MPNKIKIAHIINPVRVPESSDLFIAQPITFESMKVAQARAHKNGLQVELFCCFYPEDKELVPDGFIQTSYLQNSLLNYGVFKKGKKLPLISEILSLLYKSSNADYFIYTNVDIALQPDFYLKVAEFITRGYDGFVINRRTIPKHYVQVNQLPQMYKETGHSHPGFDCFIFKRNSVPNFELGNTVIGSVWIGGVLVSNLIMTSKNFKIFRQEHLTFHIGDDRVWESNEVDDIAEFNKRQYDDSVGKLKLRSGKINSKLRHFVAYKYPAILKLVPGRLK